MRISSREAAIDLWVQFCSYHGVPHLKSTLAFLLVLARVNTTLAADPKIVLQAAEATFSPLRVEIVAQDSFLGKKGVALKTGQNPSTETRTAEPDLVFHVRVPVAGRYTLVTHSATDDSGAALMRTAASKFESLYAQIQISGQPVLNAEVEGEKNTLIFMAQGGCYKVTPQTLRHTRRNVTD